MDHAIYNIFFELAYIMFIFLKYILYLGFFFLHTQSRCVTIDHIMCM